MNVKIIFLQVEPLGLSLVSKLPKSQTQKRMVLGGLSGCGAIVSATPSSNSLISLLSNQKVRKGMSLISINGINAETMTLNEILNEINEGKYSKRRSEQM